MEIIESPFIPKGAELFSPERMPKDMRQALKFLDLLEQHFAEQHQPEFYAERMMLSLYRLNGILKIYYGKTIYEMIQDRIHLEGLKLLKHTGMTIREISFELNICDPSWFTKCFKEREGVSPLVWRKAGRDPEINSG